MPKRSNEMFVNIFGHFGDRCAKRQELGLNPGILKMSFVSLAIVIVTIQDYYVLHVFRAKYKP